MKTDTVLASSSLTAEGNTRQSHFLLFLLISCASIPVSQESPGIVTTMDPMDTNNSVTDGGGSMTPGYISEDDIGIGSTDNVTEYPPLYGDKVFYWPTPEDMLNPSKRNPAFYPILITHIITFLLGLLGNLVTAYVMVGDRKSRSATILFLVSLSVSDLLLLILCIPLDILQYFLQFDDNGAVCKSARYTELLSATASVLNLCAVSFERFIVIVYPMRSRSVCTMSNCKKAIACVWILAVILSLPVLLTKEGFSLTFTNNVTSVSVYYCEEEDVKEGLPVAIYKFVILFAAPTIFMTICYVFVIRELWRSTRTINLLTNAHSIRAPGHVVTTGRRKIPTNLRFCPSRRNRNNMSPKPIISGKTSHHLDSQQTLMCEVTLGNSHSRSPSAVSRCSQKSVSRNSNIDTVGICGGGGDVGPDSNGNRNLQNIHKNGQCNGLNLSRSREHLRPGSSTMNMTFVQHGPRRGITTQLRPHKAEDAKKARKQVIKMLILIIFLFMICWGPKLILNITLKVALISGYPIYFPEVYYCRVIFALIPFVHSCINPIVYSFMSKNFRRSMNRQLGRCCAACGCNCRNNCGAHRNSIPMKSTARTRTTTQGVESTYSTNYCQLSDLNNTRHTEVEAVSAL